MLNRIAGEMQRWPDMRHRHRWTEREQQAREEVVRRVASTPGLSDEQREDVVEAGRRDWPLSRLTELVGEMRKSPLVRLVLPRTESEWEEQEMDLDLTPEMMDRQMRGLEITNWWTEAARQWRDQRRSSRSSYRPRPTRTERRIYRGARRVRRNVRRLVRGVRAGPDGPSPRRGAVGERRFLGLSAAAAGGAT